MINQLKSELAAFAAESSAHPASNAGNACAGVALIKPTAATLALSTISSKETGASFGLAVPIADFSTKATLSEKDTTKILLPLTIADYKPSRTPVVTDDMLIARALVNLRDDLLKVNSEAQPCLKPDKPLKLTLTFEANRSSTTGIGFLLSPVKFGISGSTASGTNQTIELDLTLLDKDGGPGVFMVAPQ